jgi:23S rRNA pseudouridine2605 synthase
VVSRPRPGAERAAPAATEAGERLQKVLANAGVASRRAAEALIAEGRVTLNGEVVREMGRRAMPGDVLQVDGRQIKVPDAATAEKEHVYIALNKPDGVVSTARDPHGRPTVIGLVASGAKGARLYPVGRLDSDSTGLLLLTNDGDLTFRLTHPRFGVDKEYRAVVRGRPGEAAIRKLREGVELEDGVTAPAKVDYLSTNEGNATLRITVHEGRKRQIRLMASAVGHPVIELKRTRFGPVELGTLEEGKWRYLAAHEVHALRKAVRLPAGPGSRTRRK